MSKTNSLLQRVRNLIYTTPIEIALGSVMFAAVGFKIGYDKSLKNSAVIPVAFSEIEQTTAKLGYEGKEPPPLTAYYSAVNDIPMKVFESRNYAFEFDGGHKSFARELETRVEMTLREHKQINEYVEEMPYLVNNARKSLKINLQAQEELPDIIRHFDDAWIDTHSDSYTTEVYMDMEGDLRTRTVYSHTVHDYAYDQQKGKLADSLLRDFINKYPDLHIEEELIRITKTGAWNEQAIEKSMRKQFDGRLPTAEEYVRIANTWAESAIAEKRKPVIENSYQRLENLAPAWQEAKHNAASAQYNTNSRYDDGPKEFQIAEAALNYLVHIYKATNDISTGINYSETHVPLLEQQIKDYIAIVLDNKAGDADMARENVMSTAQNLYQKNFEDGLDVYPFKWGKVILFSAIGLAAGALAGAGIDRYNNQNMPTNYRRRQKASSGWKP